MDALTIPNQDSMNPPVEWRPLVSEQNERDKGQRFQLFQRVNKITNDALGFIDRAKKAAPVIGNGVKNFAQNWIKDSGPAFAIGAAIRSAADTYGITISAASGGAGLALSAGVGFATRFTRELTEAQRKGTMTMAKRHILRHEETEAQTQHRVENIAKISSKLGKGARAWESFKETKAGKSLHFVTHGLEMAIAKRAYKGDVHAQTIQSFDISKISTLSPSEISKLANAAFFARATTNDKATREKAFAVYKAIRKSNGSIAGQYMSQSMGTNQGVEQRDRLKKLITREARIANMKIALGTASLQIVKAPIKSIAGFVSADAIHKTWGFVKNVLSHTRNVNGDSIAQAAETIANLSKPIQVPTSENGATPLPLDEVKQNIAVTRIAVAQEYPGVFDEQSSAVSDMSNGETATVQKTIGDGSPKVLQRPEFSKIITPHQPPLEMHVPQDPSELKNVPKPNIAETIGQHSSPPIPERTAGLWEEMLRKYTIGSPESWIKHPQNELSLHTIKEKGSILLDMGNMKGVDFAHKPDAFGFSMTLPGDSGSVLILQDISIENGVKTGLGKIRLDPNAPITDVVRVMRSDGKIDQLPRAVISKLLINPDAKIDMNGQITEFKNITDGQFTSYGSDLLRARTVSAVQIDADQSGHLHATSHATSLYRESPLPTVPVAESPPIPLQPGGGLNVPSEQNSELRVPKIHPRNDPDNPLYDPLQRNIRTEASPISVVPSDEQNFEVTPSTNERWEGVVATASAKKTPDTGDISNPAIKSPIHPDRNVVVGPKTTLDPEPSDADHIPQNTNRTIFDGPGKGVNPDHTSSSEDDVIAKISAEIRSIRSIPGNHEVDFPKMEDLPMYVLATEKLKAVDILFQLEDTVTAQKNATTENAKLFQELLKSSNMTAGELVSLKKSLARAGFDVSTIKTLIEISMVENPTKPSLLVRSLAATLNGTSKSDNGAFLKGLQQLIQDPVTLQSLIKDHIRTNNLQFDTAFRPDLSSVKDLVPVVVPETLRDKLKFMDTLNIVKFTDERIEEVLSNPLTISPIAKDIILVRGGVTNVLGDGYGILRFTGDGMRSTVGSALAEVGSNHDFLKLLGQDEMVRRLYFASIVDQNGKLLRSLIAHPSLSTELIKNYANDPKVNIHDVKFDKLIKLLQKGDKKTYDEIISLLKNGGLGEQIGRSILMNDALINANSDLKTYLSTTKNITSPDDIVRLLYAYPKLFGAEQLTPQKALELHERVPKQLPMMFDIFNHESNFQDIKNSSRRKLQSYALDVLAGKHTPIDFIRQLRTTDKVIAISQGSFERAEEYKTLILDEKRYDSHTRAMLSYIEGIDKVAPMQQYEFTDKLLLRSALTLASKAKSKLLGSGNADDYSFSGASDPYIQLVEMVFGGTKKNSLDRSLGDVDTLVFGFRHPEKYGVEYLRDLINQSGENRLAVVGNSVFRTQIANNATRLIMSSDADALLNSEFKKYSSGHIAALCARYESLIMAKELAKHMTPDQAFDAYLNIAPMGNTTSGAEVRGIAAAARMFLHKNVEDLTDAERVALIGITNAPNILSPLNNKMTEPIQNISGTLQKLYDETYPGQGKLIPKEFMTGQRIPQYKNRALILLTETLSKNFTAHQRILMIEELAKMQMDGSGGTAQASAASDEFLKQLREQGLPKNKTAYFPQVGYIQDMSDASTYKMQFDAKTGAQLELIDGTVRSSVDVSKTATEAATIVMKTAQIDNQQTDLYTFGYHVDDPHKSIIQVPVFEQLNNSGKIIQNPGISSITVGPSQEVVQKLDPTNILNKGAITPASTIKPFIAVMYELFDLPIESMVDNTPTNVPGHNIVVSNASKALDAIPQMPITSALKYSSNVPFVKPFHDLLEKDPKKWLEIQAIMSAFGLQFTEDINGQIPLKQAAAFTSIGSNYVIGKDGESGMQAMAQAYSRLFNAEKYFSDNPKLLAAAKKIREYMMSEEFVSGVNQANGKPFLSHVLSNGYSFTAKTGSLQNAPGVVNEYFAVGVVKHPNGQYDATIVRIAGQKITNIDGKPTPTTTNLRSYADVNNRGAATFVKAFAEERAKGASLPQTAH